MKYPSKSVDRYGIREEKGKKSMENDANRVWACEVWREAAERTMKNAAVIGAAFPETAAGGVYRLTPHLSSWVNGFWPGILWLVYDRTGDGSLKETARACEKKLDAVLATPENLAHDAGFIWTLSAVADYKLTGDPAAGTRGLRAAMCLASRFNPAGGFFRSWGDIPGKDTTGWTIADNMMNLPILYWASENTGDPRFRNMACRHTDTVLRHLIRPDGSANHIIKLDPVTGEAAESREDCLDYTQGAGLDSAWTRGQAWVIYGLALGSRYTGRGEYLDTAKRCAQYFLAALDDSGVPPIDFRGDPARMGTDSSAGAIAACGLLELAAQIPQSQRSMYERGAVRILKGLRCHCAEQGNAQNLLAHGATHYNADETRDVGLIYGDYFYMEALYRLSGGTAVFW